MKTKSLSSKLIVTITIFVTLAVAALSLFVIPVYHQPFKAYDTFNTRWYDHPGYWSCVTCEAPLIADEYQLK